MGADAVAVTVAVAVTEARCSALILELRYVGADGGYSTLML